jgi:hypothetical protein
VWRCDAVQAGVPSDPFLLAGDYGRRVVHLSHGGDAAVTFTIDAGAARAWREIATVTVPARGAVHHVLPADVAGDWARVTADRDAPDVTVVFCYGIRGGRVEDGGLFAALVDAGASKPWTATVFRSGEGEHLPLDLLARRVEGTTAAEARPWRIRFDQPAAEPIGAEDPASTFLRDKAVPTSVDVSFDAASAILNEGEKVFRLPKPLDPQVAADYEKPFAAGWPRGLREVATERALLNAAGTFYVLPRVTSGGAAKMQPVCSHGKRISDFCSWRGLLVLGGVRTAAGDDPRLLGQPDAARVWVGDIDELWKFPRPTGRGGPWHATAVRPAVPSDPYLMGGYDRKELELSHDANEPVRFAIEIDPTGDGQWFPYVTIDVAPRAESTHEFAEGFLAQWVRLTADHACTATATFTYE